MDSPPNTLEGIIFTTGSVTIFLSAIEIGDYFYEQTGSNLVRTLGYLVGIIPAFPFGAYMADRWDNMNQNQTTNEQDNYK
jgi:hypothetical protein